MPRTGLTKDQIVVEAARLADSYGSVEALTLAELADTLGVKPPSLYNHINGLDGLRRDLTAYALRLLRDTLRDALVGRAGDDALIAAAYAYRTFAHGHPGIYPLVVPAPPEEDIELVMLSESIVSLLLSALAAYHLDRDDSIHIIRGLRTIAHGFASIEMAGGFGMPHNPADSFDKLIRGFVSGITA